MPEPTTLYSPSSSEIRNAFDISDNFIVQCMWDYRLNMQNPCMIACFRVLPDDDTPPRIILVQRLSCGSLVLFQESPTFTNT